MDKDERLSRQMEFCREIDKEKQELRIVYRVAGKGTEEFSDKRDSERGRFPACLAYGSNDAFAQ